MKPILFFLIFLFALSSVAQEKEFHLEGRIVDSKNNPVPDVYIINYRNLDKNVSRQNGVFDARVLQGDSLIISHISYYRKVITVHSLLLNPIVQIELDTINILEVEVSPNDKTDIERARENLMFISDFKVPKFEKIKQEPNLIKDMVVANNNIMRSEASSLTFTRFSPSEKIGKIIKKIKRRKMNRRYYSDKKKR